MNVHVPKTGQQEFSGGVDGARGFGDFDFCCRPHGSDAAGLNENGLVGLRWAAGGINERDVRDGELRRWLRRGERRNEEEAQHQGEKQLSKPQSSAHIPGDRPFLESYHKRRWVEEVLVSGPRHWRAFGEALVRGVRSR